MKLMRNKEARREVIWHIAVIAAALCAELLTDTSLSSGINAIMVSFVHRTDFAIAITLRSLMARRRSS